METVYELVTRMEKDDQFGDTEISKYVSFNLRETIEKIDAYLNSKHISGETDSNGREKPFFNVVTAAVNIWFRATDIDRKDIRVRATRADQYVTSFLATILLQEWMRKNNFGVFLNEWGRTLARYGSAVAKFVEKDGELYSEVVPWNRLICDAVDFAPNVKIEKIWMTAGELRKHKGYDKELVEQLLENKVTRKNMDGTTKDTKADYILVYEVHGELPKSYLTDDDEDDDEFVQQMHVISFQGKNTKEKNFNTLYRGEERIDPYFITHLLKEDGRTLAIGAVEHLFEAQWMVNHSQKQIKDQLDLASKLLFQTADGNFVGQNALTNLENGDILIHAPDAPLTQLNNTPNIAAMQSFTQQWQQLGNQVNGINEAMTEAPKSGVAWRTVQATLNESHSLFELYTENKGLAIEEMLRLYVIPFAKKKINTTEEISAILEEHQIKQLDSMYVPNEAIRRVNQKIKDTVLSGEIYDPMEQAGAVATAEQELRDSLKNFNNQRFIKPSDIETVTWKEVLKDIEWELEVDVTNEASDVKAALETINTLLPMILNPAFEQNPQAKFLVAKALELSGSVSPVQMQAISSPEPMPPTAGMPAGPTQ